MIKRLAAFDFDATLINSFLPEYGKELWEKYYNKKYEYQGWWGRPESLDLDVFNIKPYPSVLNQLKKEQSTPDTYVIVLTSRIEKLRPYLQKILDANNIHVDKLDMKNDNRTKGQKILQYIQEFPELKEINVYDDKEDQITSYKNIKNQIPKNIIFNIYLADNGNLKLIDDNKLINVIKEEIDELKKDLGYIYHGTYDGAGYYIQKDGKMKLPDNGEEFISFTSKLPVAKYYATMKGGSDRGIILRTKLTNDFQLSPKFSKNNGYEWITKREIPIEDLEIETKFYGWIPLIKWDFIDRDIKN